MANSILTPAIITREALRILTNSLKAAKTVAKDYSDEFAKSGAKIGSTLNVRKPARYTVTTGAAASVQDHTETFVPLTFTANSQMHVDVAFTSYDLTLSLQDYSQRVLLPQMKRLADAVDYNVLQLYKGVYNQVGTPGSAVSAMSTYAQAGALIRLFGGNDGQEISFFVDPLSMVTAMGLGLSLFNPQKEISDQYKEGILSTALGMEWYEDGNAPVHTNGTFGGTPLVNGASQTGASLITDGWTPTTTTLTVGTVFTIANVFSVNPVNKQSTGRLQQFVVTAATTTDGLGNSTIAISPSIVTTGAFQNVSAAPADNAAITVAGTSGQSYQIALAWHRDAATLACAPLQVPEGVHFGYAETDPVTGLALRVVAQYSIASDSFTMRTDILATQALLYEQLACRCVVS